MPWRAGKKQSGPPPADKKGQRAHGKVKNSALISFGPMERTACHFGRLRIGYVHMLWLCMGFWFVTTTYIYV